MGAVAVLSVVIAFLLDRVAGRAEYDNSPVVAIEILLAVIAALAALICAALLLGLAVSSVVAWLKRRPQRPAGAPPGGGDTSAGPRLSGPSGPAPR
jgi:hypothetical protein